MPNDHNKVMDDLWHIIGLLEETIGMDRRNEGFGQYVVAAAVLKLADHVSDVGKKVEEGE